MSPLLYLLGLGHIVGVGKVTIQDNKEERAAGAGMCVLIATELGEQNVELL